MEREVSARNPEYLTLAQLGAIFFRVGSLAFGGGGATLAMLRNEFCARRAVVTDEEFQVLFGLSRMVPGMNLLALTVLLGFRSQGWAGALVALASLTLPSFAIIIGGCELVRSEHPGPHLAGAMRGLAVGVAALIFHTTWEVCQSALVRRPRTVQAAWLGLLALAAALTLMGTVHPGFIVVAGGALGILLYRRLDPR